MRRRRSLRGVGIAVSTALAVTLLPAQAWAAPPPGDRTGISLSALQKDVLAALDAPKAEAMSAWTGIPSMPTEYEPQKEARPVGTTTVPLTGSGDALVQAPGLPLKIGKASPTTAEPAPPAPTGTWGVEIVPVAQTENSGIDGSVIALSPPATGATPLDVELNYDSFSDLLGTEWATRLSLVQFPECFLTTPDEEFCATPVTLPEKNDPVTKTVRVTADPAAVPQPQGMSAMSGTSGSKMVFGTLDRGRGPGSNYGATPLAATGEWSAGGSGGGFSWTYPLSLPKPPAGPAPDIAFSYSSQSVDGRTGASNGQASWIGDGWDYNPGFVERRYRSCSSDDKVIDGKTPNNMGAADKDKADLCYAGPSVVMNLGSSSTELVYTPASGETPESWTPASDDGTTVVRSTGAVNGDNNGEYWVATTRDGTRYHFGRNDVDGAGTRAVTNSVFTVPVFANHPGEPCYQSIFTKSQCLNASGSPMPEAWRWNLDYVEDVHGNALVIDWAKETNLYARLGKITDKVSYVRGGYPKQISYGLRADALSADPAAKVVFTVGERCFTAAGVSCDDTEFNSKLRGDKVPWWDTPATLNCHSGMTKCLVATPTFWSRKLLRSVTTHAQRTQGSTTLTPVDQWNLRQHFPTEYADAHPPLWLDGISRIGFGTEKDEDGNWDSSPMPEVAFLPNTKEAMPNRVADNADDHTLVFNRLRLETVRTETGGEITVDYSSPCTPGATRPSPESNTGRCYPIHWSLDPDAENPPLVWWNKYVVDKVTETDRVTRQPDVVTAYTYEGGAEWAKDDDEFSEPKNRTYSGWRGYSSVVTTRGTAPAGETLTADVSQTRTKFFRGMSRDGGGAEIKVKDSAGTEIAEDLKVHQGRAYEKLAYTKSGGTVVSRDVTYPTAKETASRKRVLETGVSDLKAYRTGTVRTDHFETGAGTGGKDRVARSEFTFDEATGLLTQQYDSASPDNGTTWTDKRCTITSYANNTAKNIVGMPHRVRSTAGDCAAAPTAAPASVISDTRTSYDALNAFGTAPVKGLPYQVDTLDGDGSGWITDVRASFDALGREVKLTDAAGKSTTTAYLPTTGMPFEVKVTNALGHVTSTKSEPGRGNPLETTDGNGRASTMKYDNLGRITDVWTASHTPATDPADVKYRYRTGQMITPAVTTSTLRDNGTYNDSVVLYDGLLRPRQSQTEAVGGGRIVTDTLYNHSGLAWRTNNGYLAEDEPETEVFYPKSDYLIPNATESRYDGLGRVTSTVTIEKNAALRASTTQYGPGWTQARTGMKADGSAPLSGSQTVKAYTDVLGRTTLRRNATKTDLSDWIDTTYRYDARGAMTEVADDAGTTWSWAFDNRGRMVGSTDPDMGTSTFGYDSMDREVWKKNAGGYARHSVYDALGRQTELHNDAVDGPLLARWTYDTAPGGKGLAASSTRLYGTTEYTTAVNGYDAAGRPTGSTLTIPDVSGTKGLAGTYAYGYTYTRTGKVQTATVPATPGGLAAETLIMRYNSTGLPTTTSGLDWYTTETRYSPFGEVLRTASGRAPRRLWTTNYYDENDGRLEQTIADKEQATTRVAQTYYAYDAVGNVRYITDVQPDGDRDRQCFSYDPMGRLVHAWTAASSGCPTENSTQGAGPVRTDLTAGPDGDGYWKQYTFDKAGNRTGMIDHDLTDATMDDTYTYTYGVEVTNNGTLPPTTKQPHALVQTDSVVKRPGSTVTSKSTYTYDIAGNRKTQTVGGDTKEFNWDRGNKLGSADKENDGTNDVSYYYDAEGNRLLEITGSSRTLYLGDAEITVNLAGTATDAQRYYSHPGAPTTVRSTAGKTTGHKLTVLLSDHHGTSTSAVDMSGTQAVTRRKYDPYGNPRGTEPANWPGRRTFLGSGIDDPLTGLTHVGAREYDPVTGSFVSVDPVLNLADPLQMNGYVYSNGNPTSRLDPTGLESCYPHYCAGDNGTYGDYEEEDDPASDKYQKPKDPIEVQVKKGTAKIKVANTWLPTQAWLVKNFRYASPKLSWEHNLQSWMRASCTPGMAKAAHMVEFCGVASRNQMFGSSDVDVLDALGVKDAVNCIAKQDGSACKAVVVDMVISAGTAGLGKGAKILFKAVKTSIKKSDGALGKCLTHLATKNSFPAGTAVKMADGSEKPIEEVETGDVVLATDPETGETTAREVTAAIHSTDDKKYVDVTVSAGGSSSVITSTDHHFFWSESDQAWLEADALVPGMHLRTVSGTEAVVTAIRSYSAAVATFNLTVEGVHTYYVLAGETAVLVHNDGGFDWNKGLEDLKKDWDSGGLDDDGYHAPRGNQAENKEFRDAMREAEQRIGRQITPAERRALHDRITGQGYGYHRIVEEAKGMFGGC